MIIWANDGIEESAAESLRQKGFELYTQHLDEDSLKKKIKEIDILIVRSATKVTSDIINAATETNVLKLIIRGGVGIDNIDAACAAQNGIAVRNTPNASSNAVAELVIGHMFSLARYIGIANRTMCTGEWKKKEYEGTQLAGKTLGLIGFGRIAQETARRAAALGMNIIYTNISGAKNAFPDYKYCDLTTLLKNSDFVSLHLPFNKGSKPIIAKEELELMKDGAFLINTARGGAVDEDDLLEALNSKKIAGAALDVFVEEPTHNVKLCGHNRVSVTPHIGGSTKEAQMGIGDEIVAIVTELYGSGRGDL